MRFAPGRWARGLRLRERFALQLGTASALVAILVGIALYLHGQYAQNSLQSASLATTREALLQQPTERLLSVGHRLARSIGKPDIWDHPELMSERLAATREAAGLTEIRIFGPDGAPLYVGARQADPDDETPPEWSEAVAPTKTWITHRTGKRVYAAGPIRYRGRLTGILLISKSILPVEQEVAILEAQLHALAEVRQAESRSLAWIIGAVLVVLAASTGIVLARRMSAPILDLQSMTARIAGGDFNVLETGHRTDELGDLSRSISQMAEQLDATTVSRSFFSEIIEGMLDGLIVTTGSGVITMANGAAGRLIGLSPQELAGNPLLSYFSREKRGNKAQKDANVQVLSCADGRKIPILATASKTRLHQNDDESVVFVFRDISGIIAHQEQLQKALTDAQAANKVRTEFLANMSHELRTPLNAIIGFSDILSSNKPAPLAEEKRREFASDIKSSGEQLLNIINDVLELSKIEVGNIVLRSDEIDVGHLIGAIATLTRPKAADNGLKFSVQLNEHGHLIIEADEAKLKQILNNILSNAVKFTPAPGEVALSVDRNEDAIIFTVRDTGIGMTPEELEMAFQPFRQADNSHTRKFGGTGLGLPLARQLTELHGGRLEIISRKDHGTTVTVRLPLRAAAVKGIAA